MRASWFSSVAGVPAPGAARWNGTAWSPAGDGLNNSVYALGEHEGELFAGGSFTMSGVNAIARIARWTGSGWTSVGGGVEGGYSPGGVYALESTPWGLAAGGFFTTVGGAPSEHLGLWTDGAWQPLPTPNPVSSLRMFGGELYVGATEYAGNFTYARLNRWNGSAWQACPSPDGGSGTSVACLTVADDRLIVGGFFGAATPVTANHIAAWTGSSWTTISAGFAGLIERLYGTRPSITAMATYGDDLIAVGTFDTVSGVAARGIAAWDGLSWRPYAGGLFSADPYPRTLALCTAVYDGQLIVGGAFTTAGTVPATRIARWDGADWSAFGAGANGNVRDLLVHNGQLFAAGDFTTIGAASANRIARFDGTSWSAMGSGLTNAPQVLASYNGDLIVGGAFTTISGVAASRVARWNGSAWSALGAGVDGQVNALAVAGGHLYAGGSFNNAGGQPASKIARWDGTAWSPLGAGADGTVTDLFEHNGSLIASGSFNTIGGVATGGCARFDPATGTWEAFDEVLRPTPPFYAHRGELMMAGRVSRANSAHSDVWGRWSDALSPWIALHPSSTAASPGASVQLSAALAAGYTAQSFQWRLNDQPLTDGPRPWGSVIQGSTSPTLSITNLAALDAGNYTCLITHPCASLTTNAAVISITSACSTADFDGDGDTGTDADIEAFFACLAGNCCPTCWHLGADFNGDGDTGTDGDIEAFFRVLAGGAC
jgi:trimeric autotransporter adhesin